MFHSNPEIQIETDALAKVIEALPIGDIAPYTSLSEAVGYNVQRKPFALMKARKKVEAETGVRLETVAKVGVKKIPAAAVTGIGAAARKKIARMAKRQSQRLTGLRYNDIDASTQARIDAERSLLGAISATANAKADRIEVATQTGPLVAARVFDIVKDATA